MLDFMVISTRSTKRGAIEIYPKFIIKKSSDLMIRGGDFYAIWIEDRGLWSTEEQDALQLIDMELDQYARNNQACSCYNCGCIFTFEKEDVKVEQVGVNEHERFVECPDCRERNTVSL